MTGFVEAVRRANAPKPPEESVRLRVAAGATVVVGLLAAASEHEISTGATLASLVLVCSGMVFSHRNRRRSLGWVKILVAGGAISAMAWFVHQLSGGPVGDITSVENPLTVLFAWILIVHSFHVPARRDLVFALAGSAALMAVAAAQAVDMAFGLYALSWSAAALWTMLEVGSSALDAPRPGLRPAAAALAAVVAGALVVFLLLPAPTEAVKLDFRTNAGTAGPIGGSGALAGDAGQAVQLSHPGSPTGRTRVGGYLGFAGSLDTALRGHLGSQVVMEVRASVPSYWIGETFDRWDGQSWRSTVAGRSATLGGGSPFQLPPAADFYGRPGVDDLQTFYVKDFTADLVFHADHPEEVWFPADHLYLGGDGSIVSPIGLGRGAIYTVESSVPQPTAAELRAAPPAGSIASYTQLPRSYAEVRQLARAVTAGDADTYDEVQSLIGWIGTHTRYSTDIPPLPAGADAVDEFLFGNRTGYCEQISTALTVMLRTLGVPAREAVGYVPGPYNPITDLYTVRAEDAHAWVQVYFPGYGWVSFDPTAVVSDANPSPGSTALHIAGRWLGGLPWAPIGAAAAGAVAVALAARTGRRFLARRRAGPVAAALAAMERAGRRAGRPRRPQETVGEYGAALAGGWPDVARAVDAAAYGAVDLEAAEWRELVLAAERVQQ